MKKILASILSIIMLFSLTSCTLTINTENTDTSDLTLYENDDVSFYYDDTKLLIDGNFERDDYGVWSSNIYLKNEDGTCDYRECGILSFTNSFAIEKVAFDYNNELNGREVKTLEGDNYNYEYVSYTATYGGEEEGESTSETQVDYYGTVSGGDVNLTTFTDPGTDVSVFDDILKTIKIKHDFSGEFVDGCDFVSEQEVTFNDSVTVPVKLFAYGTTTHNESEGYISSYKNDTQITIQYYETTANIQDMLKLLTTDTVDSYKGYVSGYELRVQKTQGDDNFVYNTLVFYSGNTPMKIFSLAVQRVSDDAVLLIAINRENALSQEEVNSPAYFDIIKAYGISDYVSSVPSSEDRVEFE